MIAIEDLKKRIQDFLPAEVKTDTPTSQRIKKLTQTGHTEPVRSKALMPQGRIEQAKIGLLLHIRELAEYLFPKGRLSAEGGYWEVPTPHLIKISFLTGGYFDWKKPENRNPIRGDLIDLWMAAKEQKNFKRAIIEIEHWLSEIERRGTKFVPKEPENYFSPREVADSVFMLLLGAGRIQKVRATAKRHRQVIIEESKKIFTPEEMEGSPIEFQKPTLFRRLLEQWAFYDTKYVNEKVPSD